MAVAPGANATLLAEAAVASDADCWRQGFTFERCCKVPPIVSSLAGCWEGNRTESKCCGNATHVPADSTGPAAAAASSNPSAAAADASLQAAAGRAKDAASQGAAPIHAEATASEAGRAVPAAGHERTVSTQAKSQAATASKAVPPSATESPRAASNGAGAEIGKAAKDTAAEKPVEDKGAAPPTVQPQQAQSQEQTAKGVPERRGGGAERDLNAVTAAKGDVTRNGVVMQESGEARFLRRESSRRWATYFRKAHSLLNEMLGPEGAAGGELPPPPEEGATAMQDSSSSGRAEKSSSKRHLASDPVSVYHMIYEVANQVVAGVQLASEASDAPSDKDSQGGGGSTTGATLRAAFLSAAVVLARLAQASQSTPFEAEEFATQASATLALSCRQENQEVFNEDMEKRIKWLQREAGGGSAGGTPPAWIGQLLGRLQQRLRQADAADAKDQEDTAALEDMFQRSWQMYAEDLVEAVWRPVSGENPASQQPQLNPLDETFVATRPAGSHMWQIFPTYIMSRALKDDFRLRRSSSMSDRSGFLDNSQIITTCTPCAGLTEVVLKKYKEFEAKVQSKPSAGGTNEQDRVRRWRMRQDEVNNAFFAWQLTHDEEQEERGAAVWPELYKDSEEFRELKRVAKLAFLDYLKRIYDASLTAVDLAQLELSLWASVTPPPDEADLFADRAGASNVMGLAFHDHPMALLSGVFYAQAGGRQVQQRTPTVFADPRGTHAFRYTRHGRRNAQRAAMEEPLEPTAPFHRMAYSHALDGHMVIFPSWLVHGVPTHDGSAPRVVFSFNLHTQHGTTLASWAKTAL
eukprot:TRINITY_DN65540_c0_g2_i1.p1 TRINITY_DN65540_c0_g2~~TRINITY_DN65540_c0_g2_i1.p1  ORF type:complete len:834 (+),score=188.75 TRINITY_DN65540_c0_g2_i1:81-2504(+)